jgi:ubiquinone/menaquinone biosynthesis C-methylase UbiE
MLAMLKQKIKLAGFDNMTPVLLDLSDGEGTDMKFDIIYTLLTLHHIVDIDRVIDSFYRMLNPAGYVCIADLDEEDGSFHDEDFIGHNGFNRDDLTGRLQKHGFENISWKICYQNKKKGRDGMLREYPVFLMLGEKKA